MSAKFTVKKVDRDLYLLRIDDRETKYFEALWEIPEGITYNSYLLVDDERRVLFDGWHSRYSELFLEAISEVIDPKEIDSVIIHHMEPDHSGTLHLIAKEAKKATFYGHPLVLNMLKGMYRFEGEFRALKDMEELQIGERRLKFIYTPWLHWPETSMSYLSPEGILFSGDAFGSFGIPSGIFDDEAEMDFSLVRKYIADVIGHYIQYVQRGIDKIRGLGLDLRKIAPLHGLIWRKDPGKIVEYYLKISSGHKEKKVLVAYSSMYGFVEEAISYAIEEIRSRGYIPKVFKFTSSERSRVSDLIGEAIDSAAIVLGVPTYEAGAFPLIEEISRILAEKIVFEKPVLLIGVYGWGEMGSRKVSEILQGGKLRVIKAIKMRGRISEKEKGEILRALKEILPS